MSAGCALILAVAPFVAPQPIAEINGTKTGFFHVEQKADGRWWVIDPNGVGFVPFGIEHCRLEHHPGYKDLMLAKHGTESAWEEETLSRLKSWGFTLLGSAASSRLFRRGIPHTIFPWMGEPFAKQGGDKAIVVGPGGPGSFFPNVFHPDFADFCRARAMRFFGPQRNDPWLFGWFFDNELAWWGTPGGGAHGLYDAVSALPVEHSAHRALDGFIASHRGEWDDDRIRREFVGLIAEKYFGTITSAIRAADPNHMILGCRFAGAGMDSVAPETWRAAGRYLDIVTFNNYPWVDLESNSIRVAPSSRAPTIEVQYAEIYRLTKRPLMVTEWSFPALDKGHPCTWGAGERMQTQDERVRASALFARTMLSIPFVVGYDYFMWRDQPPEGWTATFKENCNYGLVDANGEPYSDLVKMFTRLQSEPYRWRMAPPPPKNEVAFSCMPQSAGEYIGRNAETGGKATFSSNVDGGSVAAFNGFGTLRIMLAVETDGRRSYPMTMRNLIVDSSKELGEGLPSTTVLALGGNASAKFEVKVRLTPLSDGTTLAEIQEVRNRGTRDLKFSSCRFMLVPSFDAESVYPMRQTPNVWKRPRRLSWREKGGDRRFGVETWSCDWSSKSAFWIGNEGTRHADAMFDPPRPVSLKPSESWFAPGSYYVRIRHEETNR